VKCLVKRSVEDDKRDVIGREINNSVQQQR